MGELRDGGLSVVEILVVLTCLGAFMIVIGAEYGGIVSDAGVTVALQEMNHIKEAIRDDFYPDLGVIPQDRGEDGVPASEECPSCGEDDRPWYAARYLCLRNDGEGNPEYEDMLAFLKSATDENVAEGKLIWDRYYQKGWRGPYLEQDIRERLDSDSSHAFPLITTPWAEISEELAREASDAGHSQEAERIRRGRYYLIIMDRDEDYAPLKETARIVCFGPDGKDSGSYCKDFDQEDPSTFATAEDLRKLPASDSESQDGDDYYDTGDDLVVFIFGGGAPRCPSE
jgi:hypothetical protein